MSQADNYINIRQACINETKKVLKRNIKEYGIDRVRTCPASFSIFWANKLEQKDVKDIVRYLRVHSSILKIKPMHKKAEVAQYVIDEKWLIDKFLDEASAEL